MRFEMEYDISLPAVYCSSLEISTHYDQHLESGEMDKIATVLNPEIIDNIKAVLDYFKYAQNSVEKNRQVPQKFSEWRLGNR